MKEFVSGALRVEERARKCRCGGDGVGLLDAPHGHAGVHCLDDHGDAERLQGFLDAVADLDGEPFLDLEAAGIGLDDAGDLAESRDLSVRDIGDVVLADEGEHVVLAEGEQLDVLDDDHLLVLLVKDRRADDLDAVLGIALGQELHRLRHALGRLLQAFPLRVLAQQSQDCLDMGREFRSRLLVEFLDSPVCHLPSD